MSAVPYGLQDTHKNIIEDKGKGTTEIDTEMYDGIRQYIIRSTHHSRSWGVSKTPITVKAAPAARPNAMVVCMAFCTFSICLAP